MQDLSILWVEGISSRNPEAAAALEQAGYRLARQDHSHSPADMERALRRESWDAVFCDAALPAGAWQEVLRMVRQVRPESIFIFIADHADMETAVAAIKAGADEYLLKSEPHLLGPAVARELKSRAERKRAEEAQRKSEDQLRLAQRMETVGRLAGGVAHDFNNILSVVSGYANLLQMKMARAGDAPRELAEIERAVVKATALVRQLLTFSRKQMVQPQVLELGSVLADMLPTVRMVVGEDIRVESLLDSGLGRVRADKSQLEQIVMNLAANAKDSMPRGGTLTLELAEENLDLEHFRQGEKARPGPYLRLTIRDTGGGIPNDILPRIFEPFFTTKGEGRGTGLGLSTVYGIVQQMDSNLRVESEPGKGTEFAIHIPCVPVSAYAPPGKADTIGHPSRGETILLVEDDVDLRKLTKDILVLQGYRVLESATPEEALGFARSRTLTIDLLLTDLVMPRMNGKELCEAVQDIRPEIRMLYMSGYAPESLLPDMGLIPVYHFLEKPFTPAKLLVKVRAALDVPQTEKQV